jgi:hypothetical protein
MASNELYLAVLPLIHISIDRYGLTEQTLTLFSDKNMATEFFPDEVGTYISVFERRTKYLTGGHVTGYEVKQETQENGRVIVKVIQKVTDNAG